MRRTNTILSRILHHEWVSNGKVVKANERNGKKTVVFLHGLLGSGKNLRTTAKQFTKLHPQLSALVMDSRGHGASTSFKNEKYKFDQPHTMKNCATDVIETLRHLNLTGSRNNNDQSPVGIIGHSFGARVALEYTNTLACEKTSNDISPPTQTWLLDSVPGSAQASVAQVIRAVSSVALPIEGKKQLVEDLTKNKGVDAAIAAWMTTNLIPSTDGKGGFQFAFDMNIVLPLLDSFPQQDFYQLLRNIQKARSITSSPALHVNIVRALKNDAWTPAIMNEFETFDGNFLKIHSLNTGHWVHVDDLSGLMNAMHNSFEGK